jgi:hypothetical protein
MLFSLQAHRFPRAEGASDLNQALAKPEGRSAQEEPAGLSPAGHLKRKTISRRFQRDECASRGVSSRDDGRGSSRHLRSGKAAGAFHARRRKGPHRFTQKRPQTLVFVLQSLAAAGTTKN